ncbi:SusC/RagA family TonB-linked outer membrane protein [Mucilaginibacter sp. RB4R14]|uniref:SusC/RagA family TonB-linked outer membrane protein n=1 Tax=Mucilaginibacter aurantiaciroseus TaxID=2949308 RepID=UPI002091A1CA|nr:SusC/RagA family TonB-linked outer membrane protein [Mucilaginibacter aurantiaciroseus]MCO5934185.1 SusC/RagA family TonB-linked outer membrane protein [Mucilaginibacter aurantiaciroseus]
MKSRPLQKTLKKCAVFTTITLFALVGNTYAYSPYQKEQAVKAVIKYNREATQAKITGIVTDEKNLPLPGVSVRIKGTIIGITTDVNGKFTIEANEGAILVYTFIGYHLKEVTVGAATEYNVQLLPNSRDLNEVVVIGYGTRAVKDITGAITSVKADKFENDNPASVTDVLRGAVPGISVGLNTSAKGGGAGDLQIRGKASLSGNVSPLIVLDGVIFFGDLADINPNDIDRVDVLRDPSALAVYGAQSAGGVVAITTKKGKTGAPVVSLNANTGVAQLLQNQKFYQGEDFLHWRSDVQRSANSTKPSYFYSDPRNLPSGVTLDQYLSGATGDPVNVYLQRLGLVPSEITNYKAGKVTDWSKLIFRDGIRQDYTASLSGKSDKVSYYFSGNFTKNQNLIQGGDYNNTRFRVNLEGKAASFLTVGVNAQYAVRDESHSSNPFNVAGYDLNEADWGQIIQSSPYGDVYKPDGNLTRIATDDSGLTQRNPFLGSRYNNNLYTQNVLFTNLFTKVDLPFGFKYTLNFSPQFESYKNFFFRPGANPNEIPVNGLTGTAYRSMEQRYRYNLDNILTWNKTFGIHTFDATFLLNKEKYQTWYTRAYNSQFSPNDVLGYHNIGVGTLPIESSDDRVYNADAIMGRINYNLLGKYNFTFTARRDGFSPFGLKRPRQNYQDAAVAWTFSEEKFFKTDFFKWLNYGKLRFGYGTNGNRLASGTADPSLALAAISTAKYPTVGPDGSLVNNNSVFITSLQNNDLTWERTTGPNLGLDFAFLNNRINGSIDVYNRKTTGLIVKRELLQLQGFATSNLYTNIGEVNNKGIEVLIEGKIIQSRNFNWSATGTFYLNRNKINHLYGEYQTKDAAGNTITKENDDRGNGWFVGHDIDAVWDYKIQGVWQTPEVDEAKKYGAVPGDFKLQDMNGDFKFTNDDKVFLGSTAPKFNWSLRNDFNFFKHFDFSFMLVSSIGQLKQFNQAINNAGGVGYGRQSSYALPYWTPDNPINDYARLNSGSSGTAINVWRKASFVRLQTVSLGYTFAPALIKRVGMSSAKIFVNATNAAVISDWPLWDPQNSGPTPRFLAAGVNVTF